MARGLREFRDEILQRRGSRGAFLRQLLDVGRIQVEHDALVPAAHQAAHHVRAHAAQSDHSELHS